MCATEVSSKSDKTWLISALYREKREFVIRYISLGSQHAETTASFRTGTLKTKLKGLDHIQSERGGVNVEQLHIIYWYDKCEHFLGEKWQGWKWISLCCPQYLNTQRFKLLMKSCCGSFFPPYPLRIGLSVETTIGQVFFWKCNLKCHNESHFSILPHQRSELFIIVESRLRSFHFQVEPWFLF